MQTQGKSVVCNFCHFRTKKEKVWQDHCKRERCWYVYCDSCDASFANPVESFQHYRTMGCGNDSSEFDQYFYCCKLLKTFEGFISHCHSRHWGPKNSAGVLSCDCGRFRGNYESYLDHLEILGDYWYCEDCDEYSHDCPDCLKEHTVRHALHEEVLEHQNQLAKKKLMKTHKELRLLDEEVVTLRKEKRALETKVNELLGTNDELLTQLAAFTKLPAVGCGVTRDSVVTTPPVVE